MSWEINREVKYQEVNKKEEAVGEDLWIKGRLFLGRKEVVD